MKIPYRWIREFVETGLTSRQAADRLINAGIEVASVTPLAPPDLRGVVAGPLPRPFPREEWLGDHANCLRKRRSFSKNSRISSTPYLSMAIRSMPMPNAHPVTSSGSYPTFRST